MSNSHKEHVRPFQMPVSICHTQVCLPAPVLMPYKDKLPCYYSQLISAQVQEFPSSFSRGSVKKACSLPLSTNGLPTLLHFLPVQSLITPVTTFEDMPRAGSGPVRGCAEPCRGQLITAMLFPSIPQVS